MVRLACLQAAAAAWAVASAGALKAPLLRASARSAAAANLTGSAAAGATVTGLAAARANATSAAAHLARGAPCQCEPSNPLWTPQARTAPKCVFIDLGAADGNSFHSFLNNQYGPVSNCPNGAWEAWLVEANPRFNGPLQQLQTTYPGQVHIESSTAAFSCEGTTNFFLDTTSHEHNYWGSSMSPNAGDVQRSGSQSVSVKLMNLARLIAEQVIPSDWVMVKMDIEGAEWDVLPCLAQAQSSAMIDRLYMEVHPGSLNVTGTTQAQFDAARAALVAKGVDIPQYFSNTL